MITTTTTTTTATPAAGTNVAVSFPYRFDEEEHLQVYRVSSIGTRTTLTEGVHYSVSGAGDSGGGTLTIFTVNSGDTIVVAREVDITQQQDYVSNQKFPAASHEGQLDKQIMIDQQLQGGLNRAIKVLPGEPNPVVSGRADREETIMVWDSNGDYTEDTPAQLWSRLPVPTGTISGVGMKTFADDAARAAAAYAPDFVGQLAVQIDTNKLYKAIGVTAGDWQLEDIHDAKVVTTAAALKDANEDATVTRIAIRGNIAIDEDLAESNAIGRTKQLYILGDGSFTMDGTNRLEINCPIHAHPHQQIFKGTLITSGAGTTNAAPSVFGTFGGCDRYFGWWVSGVFPEVTDHTDALQSAIRSFQVLNELVGTTILPDFKSGNGVTTSAHFRGRLILPAGTLIIRGTIFCHDRPCIIEGIGENGSYIRFEDGDTALDATLSGNTFTLASGTLADGNRVAINVLALPATTTAPEMSKSLLDDEESTTLKTFKVINWNGGAKTFQLADVGQSTAIEWSTTGTDFTVSKCQLTGYTEAFDTSSVLNGIEFRNLAVSISRTCSPSIAIFDFGVGGFLEHTRIEGCSLLIEYGGNMVRADASSGLNHVTFVRNTCTYDGVELAPIIPTGTDFDAIDNTAKTVTITTALAGTVVESFLTFNGTRYWLRNETRSETVVVRASESSNDVLKLMDTTDGDAPDLSAWQTTDVWYLSAYQVGGLRELTAAQRSHLVFSGFDFKFTADNNTFVRGQIGCYVTNSTRAATLCTRNNHVEAMRAWVYIDSASTCSISCIGDRYYSPSEEDRYVLFNVSSGNAVIDCQVTAYRNTNFNPITLYYDMNNNGQTSDSSQRIGAQGIQATAASGEAKHAHAKVTSSSSGYAAYHSGRVDPNDWTSLSAADVATALGLTSFYRADTSTNSGDGTAVTAWPVAAGAAGAFASVGAGSDPSYDADGMNGYPAVVFGGTKYLVKAAQAGFPLPNTNGGMFAVFSFDAVTPTQHIFDVAATDSTRKLLRLETVSGASVVRFRYNSAANNNSFGSSTPPTADTPTALCAMWYSNGSVAAAYGFQNLFTVNTSSHSAVGAQVSDITLARNASASDGYLTGKISDIGFWATRPTMAQMRMCLGYVARRYGCKMRQE